jgi:branched-subunit amino acid transport protein AzlD
MSPVDAMLTVAVTAVVTFLIRYLPFALFGQQKRPAKVLTDISRLLPAAIIAVLVVYCLKTINFLQVSQFLPQLIAVAIVAGLHIWKRNNLLSIGVGTVCYMVMVQGAFGV